MAKKTVSLSFRDIVLGADADVIRQALEARVQIDELIVERQAAYERIAALETQVEDAFGEAGAFPFPAPPLPVAGMDPKADSFKRSPAVLKAAAAVKPAAKPIEPTAAADVSNEPTEAIDEADESDTSSDES
ncbi:hypothetical protein [Synoicihabitans lomoniglobus]|uniref:Uncharacterized protein n=1 Tax=Synoicihabitans lomoniglobus TaxID=2909285 RepID=A0AAF0CN48_9BACT|nr:hypothetical protein [Opitutaceae bacterium LMO-M01]WED64146.1 hypothetical protein PXH66_17550 [Opitutaceae bacterium LMO-M01]